MHRRPPPREVCPCFEQMDHVVCSKANGVAVEGHSLWRKHLRPYYKTVYLIETLSKHRTLFRRLVLSHSYHHGHVRGYTCTSGNRCSCRHYTRNSIYYLLHHCFFMRFIRRGHVSNDTKYTNVWQSCAMSHPSFRHTDGFSPYPLQVGLEPTTFRLTAECSTDWTIGEKTIAVYTTYYIKKAVLLLFFK